MRWRTVLTIVFLITLFSPTLRDGDGLPLSSYPMYAQPRSPLIDFVVPVGRDGVGNPVALSTSQIAATSDPLIAESFLRQQVNAGNADELCVGIASRVQSSDAVTIEIRLERRRVVDHALGRDSLVESTLVATCLVFSL